MMQTRPRTTLLGTLLTIVGLSSQILFGLARTPACEGVFGCGSPEWELTCIGNCATVCSKHTAMGTDPITGQPKEVTFCKCRGTGGTGVPECCTLFTHVNPSGAIEIWASGDCGTENCPGAVGSTCTNVIDFPVGGGGGCSQAECDERV